MSARRRLWIAGAAAFLLLLLPFANFVKTNYWDGSFVSASFVWFFVKTAPLVLAGAAAATGLLHSYASKRARHALSRAMLAVAAAFFLLFFYHRFVPLFPDTVEGSVPAVSYLILVALLAALLFRLAGRAAVVVAVLFFAAANVALTLPLVARMTAEAARTALHSGAPAEPPAVATGQARPNVYYFILDAYGSVSSLRRHLDYDNTPFIAAMERRGFYHAAGALASYNRTMFTLAAIFAQDYFVADALTLEEGGRRWLTYPQLLNAPQPPSLVAEAGSQGYAFYLVGNYWARCAGPWVSCYAGEDGSAYLADVFWSATPGAALVAQARAGGAEDLPDVDGIGRLLARLREEGPPPAPTFTFIHHLSPHAPYLFHADCSLRDEYGADLQDWPEEAKPYFLENLECVNLKAAQAADEILALDPEAVIVFQGDHGSSFTVDWEAPFDDWRPEWIHERSTILNLVRLPERCRPWLAPDLDNVATVRAVMGCVSGRPPAPGGPRGYLSTFSKANPDHGRLRLIDPASIRNLTEAARD